MINTSSESAAPAVVVAAAADATAAFETTSPFCLLSGSTVTGDEVAETGTTIDVLFLCSGVDVSSNGIKSIKNKKKTSNFPFHIVEVREN